MAEVKNTFGVLEGTLAYAKIAQADLKYQSKDTEYSIVVIVDEDTADDWDTQFKKQPAKKIKATEFEDKYRFPCPIEGAKNVYAITLKKDATKDGEPFYPEHRPKVLLDTSDGERVDITESRLIANGSYGKVSYRISTNDFGTFAKLNNVLMDEKGFKEYITNTGGVGSEFGEGKPVTKEAPRKEATQARKAKDEDPVGDYEPAEEKPKATAKKPAKPSKPVLDDDDSDSSPF